MTSLTFFLQDIVTPSEPDVKALPERSKGVRRQTWGRAIPFKVEKNK